MQNGFTYIYDSDNRRALLRTGCPENPDTHCGGPSGPTCLTFCTARMQYDSIGGANVPSGYLALCAPYYMKCFDAVAPWPLNTLRIQFPSQESTNGVDSSIPQMVPVTNVTACLRMTFEILLFCEYCPLLMYT